MLKILNLVSELETSGGKKHAIAEISVHDSSELATETAGYIFTDGSIAWAISTGIFYGLSNGTWYPQNGGV